MFKRFLFYCGTFLLLTLTQVNIADTQTSFQDAPTIKFMNAQPFSSQTLEGNVVLLNFWASWCSPCVEELPSMNRLHAQLDSSKVQMLAVNYGESRESVSQFLQRTSIDFPVLLDPQLNFARYWKISAMPSTLVIDQQGVVIDVIIGARDWAQPEIVDRIRSLIVKP